MSVGLNPNRMEIDNMAGVIARDLDAATDQCLEFKEYLDAHVDSEFIDKGYTQDEVTLLKSAYTDAAKLAMIFRGLDTAAAPYDYRTFLKLLWGFGSVK